MHDEFEIFRAEAYGRCLESSGRGEVEAREVEAREAGQVPVDGRISRRHSSVGIHRTRTPRRRTSQVSIEVRDKGFVGISWSGADADVTVEIQPPSPTDEPSRFDDQSSRFDDQSSRFDDQSSRFRRFVEAQKFGSGKSGLCRRKTAPAEQRRIYQEESRMKASKTILVTNDWPCGKITAPENTGDVMTTCVSNRKTSLTDSDARDVAVTLNANGRPRVLTLTPRQPHPIGRRRSTTCTPERLGIGNHLSGRCKYRRNSYAGSQQNQAASGSNSRSSGRVNSAIIYLPDGLSSKSTSPGSYGTVVGRPRSYEDLGLHPDNRRSSTDSRLDHTGSGSGLSNGSTALDQNQTDVGLQRSNQTLNGGNSPLGGLPESPTVAEDPAQIYTILVLGAPGVGKTTLTHQLMTSEYLANKEDPFQEPDPPSREHSVCIRLDDEESTIRLIDDDSGKDEVGGDELDVDAYLVVFSVTSRSSFSFAEVCVNRLRRTKPRQAVILLVANKQDQVRSRVISTAEGKRLSAKRFCRFLEVSALLDHRVDEVLASAVRETRLRRKRLEANDRDSEDSAHQKPCFLLAFSFCGKILR